MNVPEKMLKVIAALYKDPQFRVVTEEETSDFVEQKSGIRQGCPLSPYLFVILMSVLFEDIHEKVNPKLFRLKGGIIDGLDFSEILYADDTLLVPKNDKDATLLLNEIEKESEYYNMKLNEDKCEYIAMNGTANIKFQNGTLMNSTDKATYLRGILTKDSNPRVEVRARMSATIPIVRRLENFWTHTHCSEKWKLNVYNAVIISKLAYGLETLQYTDAVGKMLDTFQQRGLRKILGILPTYIDRTNTNEEVFRLANKARGCDDDPTKVKLCPLSGNIKKRKMILLGHVIRAGERNPRDPMFQVTFEDKTLKTKTTAFRRVGKPRHKWHAETMTEAWTYTQHYKDNGKPTYKDTPAQRKILQQTAIDRKEPFQRTKSEKAKSPLLTERLRIFQ